jgi:hypothetical protein
MIRALAWKEFREQRAIWIAIASLAVLLMIALIQLLEPAGTVSVNSEKAAILAAVVVSLAAIYGLVCGSMTLAGDKEAGTQEFLDCLTARRVRLWWPKVLAGLSLTIAQGLFLAGLASAVGFPPVWDGPVFVVAVCGLVTFAYGILSSSLCRSVLSSVGAAIPLSLLLPAMALLVLLGAWKIAIPKAWLSDEVGIRLMGILCFVIPPILSLAASGSIYCRPDYGRALGRLKAETPGRSPTLAGWRSLLWLCWRQGRNEALALAVSGLIIGLAVPPRAIPFSVWPLATLGLGVWCGVAVFAKEQGGNYYRFWGAQRLPPGRVWLVKTLFWFTVAGVGAIAILFGVAVHLFLADEHQRQVWHHLTSAENAWLMQLMGPWLFAWLWVVNGFCFGQFFALVWRKAVVAVVVTIGAALGVAWLWFPSLVSGGLHSWQVWAVPVLLLAASRLSMWSWVSERLYTMKPLMLLGASGLLSVVWLVGNLWYRVAEVPDVGEPVDVTAFMLGLPKPEENQARKALTDAFEAFQKHDKEVTQKLGPPKPPPPSENKAKLTSPPEQGEERVEPAELAGGEIMAGAEVDETFPTNPTYYDLISRVLEKGWSEESPDLTKWLDQMFQREWVKQIQEASELSPGALIDLRTANFWVQADTVVPSRNVAMVFVARALQLQSKGDDRSSLDHLLLVLRLSRHLRSHALPFQELLGQGVERLALEGIDRWLDRLGRKPDLVRRALDELTKHETALPSPTEPIKAQYLQMRNALGDPKMLDLIARNSRQEEWTGQEDILHLAWKLPWEKARLLRIMNAMFAGWLRAAEADYTDLVNVQIKREHRSAEDWTWNLGIWLPPATSSGTEVAAETMSRFLGQSLLRNWLPYGFSVEYAKSLCLLRGTRLKLALVLYEFDFGKAAPDLQAVERYVRPLPNDPFSGKAFHYRVSEGEAIPVSGSSAEETKRVSPGQGILWSVGLDAIDNDGMRAGNINLPPSGWHPSAQLDLVFVVPKAKEK